MRVKKWIERKYPEHAGRLRQLYSDDQLSFYLREKEGFYGLDPDGKLFLARYTLAGKEKLYTNGEIKIINKQYSGSNK